MKHILAKLSLFLFISFPLAQFQPQTTAELQTAVDAWVDNQTAAAATCGTDDSPSPLPLPRSPRLTACPHDIVQVRRHQHVGHEPSHRLQLALLWAQRPQLRAVRLQRGQGELQRRRKCVGYEPRRDTVRCAAPAVHCSLRARAFALATTSADECGACV